MSNNDRYKYVGDFWERPGDIRMLGPLSVEKKVTKVIFNLRGISHDMPWNFTNTGAKNNFYSCFLPW